MDCGLYQLISINTYIKQIVPISSTYSEKIKNKISTIFTLQSSRGNNYILIIYHHNSNANLAQPIKNRTATEINMVEKEYTKLSSKQVFTQKYMYWTMKRHTIWNTPR